MMNLLLNYQILFDKPLFWLYIASMVMDLLLGNMKAWIHNDIDSNVGVKGTIKHFGLLAFVVIFLPSVTLYMGDSVISQSVMAYFTYQYIISIIENLALLGFHLPDSITHKFRRIEDSTKDDES